MEQTRSEMSVREVAKSLGIRLGTVYQLLWDDALSGRKDERGEWRVDSESVEHYRLRRSIRSTASRTALQRGAIDIVSA